MPSDHVSDFVAHDAGKLVEAIRLLDRASIHIDEAPGKCEGVYFRRVHDREVPVEVCTTGARGHRLPERSDEPVDGGITYEWHLRIDFRGIGGADGVLLLRCNGARRCYRESDEHTRRADKAGRSGSRED